jgi:hypothetical protein
MNCRIEALSMTALRLSDADRSRRDKLVGMLGSSFDGERSNALAMLQRMANSYRIPIHELLLSGNNRTESSFDRLRAEREACEANLRAERAEQAGREAQPAHPAKPDPTVPELPPNWREFFAAAEQRNRSLFFPTAWESNFVTDLIARGTRWASPKQTVIIARILEKAAVLNSRTTGAVAEDWEDIP